MLYICQGRPCAVAELQRLGERQSIEADGLLPRTGMDDVLAVFVQHLGLTRLESHLVEEWRSPHQLDECALPTCRLSGFLGRRARCSGIVRPDAGH